MISKTTDRGAAAANSSGVVLVAATPLAVRRLTEIYAPLEKLGSARLAKYSVAELETIRDFLGQGIELQSRQAERIRLAR